MTIVTLYFVNNKTGEIVPEARNIDAKELIENPYEKVINFKSKDQKMKNLKKYYSGRNSFKSYNSKWRRDRD